MKDKILSILFVTILIIFLILGMFIKDKEISLFERRKLMSSETLKKDFFENLDDYMTEQFPFRDTFMSISSVYNRVILNNIENNDVYVIGDTIIDKNYPLDEKSVDAFIRKINYINSEYLKECNVYYMIIPDKSYFLDNEEYLKIDYDYLFEKVKSNLDIDYIDASNIFSLDDYYKTDIHIKQPSYFKLMSALDKSLNFGYEDIDYEKLIFNDFYGASSSKVHFARKEDIEYLVNEDIKTLKVDHLEFGIKDVYDEAMLGGVDSYNLFLSGPSSVVNIENEKARDKKELIIFRDSFANSLAPLLIPYYSKITLIDLRYINDEYISNYVNFENKDVLFIYSTLIINNSNILKVSVK